MDFKQFVQLLRKNGIPLNLYGVEKAKTLEKLFKEVSEGECELVKENGKLKRKVKVVSLNVFNHDSSMILFEEMQIFEDGRRRTRNLHSSMGEKIKLNEEVGTTALRLIKEEFPVLLMGDESLKTLLKKESFVEEKKSPSYPGLITVYKFFLFSIQLMLDIPLIQTMTFEEDKTTIWNWKLVDQ